MATKTAFRQDMPPAGGYKPICYKRIPAKTYFSGRTMILGYLGITAGACYAHYLNYLLLHNEEVEQRSASFALYPMLLAERDREYLKQLRRNRDEEAKLMANVEGWEVGTYYGEPIYKTISKDKWQDPKFAEYYIHAHYKDFSKRANIALMS